MGAKVSKIPELVQDRILNYLSVTDAVTLSHVDDDIDTMVKMNRQFWLRKAKFLHFLDPFTFQFLDHAPCLRLHEIRREVVKADNMLQRARQRLDERQDIETQKNVGSEITFIAVDEKLCNVAVQLFSNITHIYSLDRFDDPPTIVQNPHAISEIMINGEYLFFRPPINHARHHTDAIRWTPRDNYPQLSRPITEHLGPSFGDIEILRPLAPLPGKCYPSFHSGKKMVNPDYQMRKSTQMLLVHDPIGNSLLSYLLTTLSFNPSAIKYRLEPDEKLRDHAAREYLVIMVIEIQGCLIYRSYNPVAHEVIREFRLTPNVTNKRPYIVFPYILLYETRTGYVLPIGAAVNLPRGYQPGRICLEAHHIPSQHTSVDLHFTVGPSLPRFIPSSRSFFAFFGEPYQWSIETLLVDELTNSNENNQDPFFDFTDSPVFASLGLSIFYARNNSTLIYKRYAIS